MNSRRARGAPPCSCHVDAARNGTYFSAHVVASAYPTGGTHRAAPFCIRQTPGTQGWPHENQHDGFRVIVKDFRQRIRFITRAIPAATNSHELIRDIEREHAGGGFIEPCLPTSSKQPSSARADRVLRSNPGMAQFRSATSANKRHSLVEEVAHHVMAAEKLHADDTPVPVLAPGTGKTKTDGCGCICG